MNCVIHYDGDGNGILYYPCLIKLNSALTYFHNVYIKSIIDDITMSMVCVEAKTKGDEVVNRQQKIVKKQRN
jgi:hypothetical protein